MQGQETAKRRRLADFGRLLFLSFVTLAAAEAAAAPLQRYIFVQPANPRLVGLHPDPAPRTAYQHDQGSNSSSSSSVDSKRFFGVAPLIVSSKHVIKPGEKTGSMNGVNYGCADRDCKTAVIVHDRWRQD